MVIDFLFIYGADILQMHIVTYQPKYRIPAKTRHWTNVGSMLGRRRRRRANIEPTFGQCLVFAGMRYSSHTLFLLLGADIMVYTYDLIQKEVLKNLPTDKDKKI